VVVQISDDSGSEVIRREVLVSELHPERFAHVEEAEEVGEGHLDAFLVLHRRLTETQPVEERVDGGKKELHEDVAGEQD